VCRCNRIIHKFRTVRTSGSGVALICREEEEELSPLQFWAAPRICLPCCCPWRWSWRRRRHCCEGMCHTATAQPWPAGPCKCSERVKDGILISNEMRICLIVTTSVTSLVPSYRKGNADEESKRRCRWLPPGSHSVSFSPGLLYDPVTALTRRIWWIRHMLVHPTDWQWHWQVKRSVSYETQ